MSEDDRLAGMVPWHVEWGVIDYQVRKDGTLKPVWGWYRTYRDAREVEKLRPYFDAAPEKKRG